MRVDVRLFARYREAAGRDRIEIELAAGGTVEAAWEAVVHRLPALSPYRPFTLFAVGHDYVEPEHSLRADDELCLFPPVSGGAGAATDIYRVVTEPLSPDTIAAEVDDPGAGGIVIFSGVVRNETGGRPVKFLEYEAHAPMAEVKMREIGESLRARWSGVKRVAMLHRIGRLEIGEASVLIAVSAAHRGDAFEACRYAIDTLKRTVPVWKKEHFEDGEVWVEGPVETVEVP
jgi:molybdopterin synthase catalytic subunit